MTKKMTQAQVNKKYRGKYVRVLKTYDYESRQWMYEVGKVYSKIHENTTLGEDVGTSREYTR